MKFRVAVAQIDNVLGNVARNVALHASAARKARRLGARLVVFPELSLSGYSIKDMNWDAALTRENSRKLAPLLEVSKAITILLGCVEESDEFGLHNSALMIERGSAKVVHRKVYPPTYGMFEELRYFSPGGRVRAFDTRLGRMGALICEDLWHLPLPYILAMDGASVIFGMAASPTRLSSDKNRLRIAEVNAEHHRSLARLLSTYVVFCNRVGIEDGVNFWGGSEVIGPGGDVVAAAKLFDEDLIVAEIDDNELRRARRLSRHFLDDDPSFVVGQLRAVLRDRSS